MKLSLSQELVIANRFKGKVLCSVPLSKLGFGLACACLGLGNAVPTAVSSCVQLPYWVQKAMFPGGLHNFWPLLFPLPFLQ